MAVVIDIINGAGGRLTDLGYEYDRVAKITALVAAAGHARFEEAVAALAAYTGTVLTPEDNIVIGVEHPTSAGTYLREIGFQHDSTDILELRLVYRPPDAPAFDPEDQLIEVGAALEQQQGNTDHAGDAIEVVHDGITQGVMLSIMRPKATAVVVSNREENPLDLSILYVGRVNSGAFSLDPAAASRQWICTSIIGRSRDGGNNFTVTREYAYNQDTWDQVVVYIDPATGRPPEDLTATGRKVVQVYESVDLNGSLI